jgi:hypothetical protein
MVHERGLGASGMHAEDKYNAPETHHSWHECSPSAACCKQRTGLSVHAGGAGRGEAGRGEAGGAGRGGDVSEGQRLYRSNNRCAWW